MFENVLMKLNQIPELTQEERVKYAKQLEYINDRTQKVHEMSKCLPSFDEEAKAIHKKMIDGHKQVDQMYLQKSKLYSALLRYQKMVEDSSTLHKDVENSLNLLKEVERRFKPDETLKNE